MFSLTFGDLLNLPFSSYGKPAESYGYLNPSQGYMSFISPYRHVSERSDSSFHVMLNVKHFRPDEIDVRTVDNYVVVHGKHEEQLDEHGLVSREFTRRYKLPDNVESEMVSSSLNKDGVLTIQAPSKMAGDDTKNERIVPIDVQHSGIVESRPPREQQQQ